AFPAGGVSVMQFNEGIGGQNVFHLHFHVIPRYEGEALRPHAGQVTDMAAIAADAALLRRALEQTGI
ncbi:MAG: HIT domain-containing protein, partial [Hyphomicrobiaceae bacterium]|nr:HIT domain-containing protein [Hyphomicrobiaceae bacterium]